MVAVPANEFAGTRFGPLERFAEIDSTNSYLVQRAHGGAPAGLVAMADVQTAGRGRLGRTWVAPAGGSLLVSVLLRPALAIEAWPALLAAAGLAAVDAVTALCDVPARQKWPNDVVVGDRKLAGLLAEALPAQGAVILGLGCNIDWPAVPDDLATIATAVSLVGGRVQPREVLLRGWLERLDGWIGMLERDLTTGQRWLRHAQQRRSATLGRRVRAELPGGTVEGIAAGLEPGGELVVRTDAGELVTVTAGDVIHLR
jgi:BirA family biotin operon repressor/biotin-[acetyl-CoA-carboxylase] ligase